MQTRKIIAMMATLFVAGTTTTAAIAQIYGPYTDPVRMAFARQGCGEGKWEVKGYPNYRDCYDDYYRGYPNDPNPDPE